MFAKFSVSLLLAVSLSCFAQVAARGGYATTSGPAVLVAPASAANAPLIATPDIALPGSGPAVGVPLGNTNPNDSRVSSGPSVYDPNAILPPAAEGSVIPTPVFDENYANAQPFSNGTASANAPRFELGIQQFESGLPDNRSSVPSLAEIARSNRAQRHQNARAFNNDSIAQLNAAGVRTGNLGPEDSRVVASAASQNSLPATPAQTEAAGNTLMAQNQPPALPQSDQNEAAQPAQTAAQASTANQQRHHAADQQAPTANKASEATRANQNSENSATLPQTGSSLPLFAIIGFIGLAGGIIYLARR